MSAKFYSSEGIVLSRKNYGEADRILDVFSKNYGKLKLLAKGVRQPRSKKRGALEVFSHIKFSARKGRGIDVMTEAEVVNSYAKIRKDLRKTSVAYFFIEAVGRLIREGEKEIDVFKLLISYLTYLINAKNLKALRQNFTYELLTVLGFWPKGKIMFDADGKLEAVLETRLNSKRIAKKILT